MRRAERFVQVQVHHVHAQFAWPRHAGQRVHVRTIHIEQCAPGMKNFCDFRNPLLENSQRRRIRDHQRRDVIRHQIPQFIHIDLAVRFGLDVFNLVAGNHCRRGIRSVRRVRNQNFPPRIPLLFKVRANQQQSGQLTLRPRGRLQRDRIHPRNFEQAFLQQL